MLNCRAVTPGISVGDTDLCNASVCFCQSKAFTVRQNNQWLLLCSFNSLFLQNKRTCSCAFSAHISISVRWSKAFLSVHVDLVDICAQCLFLQSKILLERNGTGSGPKATLTAWNSCFWTAAYPQHRHFVIAVQHDTCCPSKWKKRHLGCPSALMGRTALLDCCDNINLHRKLLYTDKQRDKACRFLCLLERHVSHFAGNVELCGAEHPGGGAASSGSAPALPGTSSACLEYATFSHRQAGGWFVLLGATVVLGGQLCTVLLAGLRLCSSSPTHSASASLPKVPNLMATGKKVLQYEYCQTQPVRTSWKYYLRSQQLLSTTREQNTRAAYTSQPVNYNVRRQISCLHAGSP